VRDHVSGVLCEHLQQAVFLGRQYNAHAIAEHGARRQINREMPDLDHRLARSAAGLAAQRRAGARQQLGHAERLHHIVVGAGLEQSYLVRVAGAHRKNDDRHRGPSPEALHDARAIHVRQVEIEHDQVEWAQRGGAQSCFAGFFLEHREMREIETGAQEAADLRLVVDDEDSRRVTHRHPHPRPAAA